MGKPYKPHTLPAQDLSQNKNPCGYKIAGTSAALEAPRAGCPKRLSCNCLGFIELRVGITILRGLYTGQLLNPKHLNLGRLQNSEHLTFTSSVYERMSFSRACGGTHERAEGNALPQLPAEGDNRLIDTLFTSQASTDLINWVLKGSRV